LTTLKDRYDVRCLDFPSMTRYSVITRRSVLLAGSIGLLIAHPLGRAQTAAPVRRVGWFSIGSSTSPLDGYVAFKQGMDDLGWKEGKNVEYRSVYADGEVSRLDAWPANWSGRRST